MSGQSSGLFSSLCGFATTGVALVRTRLELLRVEAKEEVGRLSGLIWWGIAAVMLGVGGMLFLAVFITVLLWDSQRLLALGIFSALFLFAALIAGVMATRLARRPSQLFAATLTELHHDEAALKSGDSQP